MSKFTNSYLHHTLETRLAFGDVGSCPIDQTPAQSFNLDPHTGRPMSDIQRLVHIQNDLQLASEFAQLQEFKPKFIDKEMTDVDALKFAVPRLCQLSSELVEHRLGCMKRLMDEQSKAKDAALKKEESEFYEKIRSRLSKKE